jgi:Uma2 family endonuclease
MATVAAGSTTRRPMLYGEYLALGETLHHEYYDGHVVVNPPSRQHVRVARRLARLLEDACPKEYEVLPEAGWRVGPEEDYVPDLVVAAIDAPGPDTLTVPPLLVVEVTSRSTRSADFTRKYAAYARGGCPWYWIVDMDEQAILISRLEPRGYLQVEGLHGGQQAVTQPFPLTVDLPQLFS